MTHRNTESALKYLVVQKRGNRPAIRVLGPDEVITDRFESWALNTGKRVLTVETVLPRRLKSFHIGGNFSGYAMYGLSYEELVLVMQELLGESDRQRFERLRAERAGSRVPARDVGAERALAASAIAATLLVGIGRVLWTIGKGLAFLVVLPVLVSFVTKGRSKH